MFADKLVIKALFETYFNIRKKNWGLVDEDEKITLPEPDSIQMGKIKTCLDLLSELASVDNNSVNDWLAFVKKIDIAQANELPTLANRLYLTEPYLANVLAAINSYIITSMQDEAKFQEIKKNLINELAITENAIKHKLGDVQETNDKYIALGKELALYTPSGIHIKYFNNTIKSQDTASQVNNETAFADYEANATNGTRNITLSVKIRAALRARDAEQKAAPAESPEKKGKISPLRENSTFKTQSKEKEVKKTPKKKDQEEVVEEKRHRRKAHGG